MRALSLAVLFDFSGVSVWRLHEGGVNATAAIEDDAKPHGVRDAGEQHDSKEKEQNVAGKLAQDLAFRAECLDRLNPQTAPRRPQRRQQCDQRHEHSHAQQ